MIARIALASAFAAAIAATSLAAQVRMPRMPVLIPIGQGQPQPPPPGVPAIPPAVLQGSLITAAGSDTVYFPPRGHNVDANSAAILQRQARWLLANPFVMVRVEGHAGPRDPRDYALAIAERRANSVRDFLILQGVAPHRITVVSWGKERPGSLRVGTALVAAGPRVVTKVQ